MCFTPLISLITAIIEFSLAIILFTFFKKTTLRNFFGAIIIILGFYQFTEFMLCIGNAPFLWAAIGFSFYSILPSLALHASIRFTKKKANIPLIYLVPSIAIITALFAKGFITSAECSRFFVTVATIFHSTSTLSTIAMTIYSTYYFGFIILAILILYLDYIEQKNKIKKEIEIVETSGILLMAFPTFILIVLFPALGIMFPSVLCAFAIFVSIAAFIGVYLESKIRIKK